MYDAMFIVHALELQSTGILYSYKNWYVVQFFSPPLFQMKVIALLQQMSASLDLNTLSCMSYAMTI